MTSAPTYKEYKSGPKSYRTFCNQCGSGLTWKSGEMLPGKTILMTGTLDEEVLIGKIIKGSERKTERGIEYDREKAWGDELLKPKMSLFWSETIAGITDQDFGQEKWLYNDGDGKSFR